ncbi:hypothetical protein E2C01_075167 [Portunus trituberculatus]|uniref:Uncharacterized protein n=1 Tax=Portunus trituberculatus TaxID=210409 RepID=A0A5B7IJB2_PORTR|nr:hypothetical protein [Portunus trituberculatus]
MQELQLAKGNKIWKKKAHCVASSLKDMVVNQNSKINVLTPCSWKKSSRRKMEIQKQAGSFRVYQ